MRTAVRVAVERLLSTSGSSTSRAYSVHFGQQMMAPSVLSMTESLESAMVER